MGLRCAVIGEGTLATHCSEMLVERGHHVVVVSSRDRQVVEWACAAGVQLASGLDELAERVESEQVHYLFSIRNPRILGPELLALPKVAAINYHDAPLPRYAGTHATSWAILNQETTHGVTWHEMAEDVDAGGILAQQLVEVAPDETALSLNAKCYSAAIDAFDRLLDQLEGDGPVATPQDLEQRSYYGRFERPPGAASLAWDVPASSLESLVRALDFGPYPNRLGLPRVAIGEEHFLLRDAVISEASTTRGAPGVVTQIDETGIHVATADGELVMRRLQTVVGEDVSPAELQRRGLRIGDVITSGEPTARLIADLDDRVVKHERFWSPRLADLRPFLLADVVAPLAGDTRTTGGRPVTTEVAVPRDLPDLLGSIVADPADLVAAAFLAFLSRLEDEPFDVGYTDDRLTELVSGADSVFAAHVPLRVDDTGDRDLVASCVHLVDELRAVRARDTFAFDLVARDPALSARRGTSPRSWWTVAVERGAGPTGRSRAGLTVVVPDDGSTLALAYDAGELDPADVEALGDRFTVFLREAASRPGTPLHEVPVLLDQERALLAGLAAPTSALGAGERAPGVDELFARCAAMTPGAVAVVMGDEEMTYRQLDDRVELLADELVARGAGPGVLVSVLLDRSFDLVVALLAIARAGAAFVPLDPSLPDERIRYILGDSVARLALTHSSLAGRVVVEDDAVQVVELDTIQLGSAPPRGARVVGDDALAYVLYTSGSTGAPKGVKVPRSALANHLRWYLDQFELSPTDVMLLKISIGFDASLLEIFGPILAGGRLVLVEPGRHNDVPHICRLVREHEVTVLVSVPSLLRVLLEEPELAVATSLRHIVVGGEQLTMDLVRQVHDRLGCAMHNCYGPTEATIEASTWRCDPSWPRPVAPIGRPIDGARALVLDRHGQPLPVGRVGELFLGGAGLADGYLNRPELDAERFVAEPGDHAERVYRTGDLVRVLPEGVLEFVGRVDDQVKLRGFRVELGEIEVALEREEGVEAAAVVLHQTAAGVDALVGYVVPERSAVLVPDDLRAGLRGRLPEYMVPQQVLVIDELPLSPNGKVDRRRLPEPTLARIGATAEPTPPRTPTERALVAIWEDLLGVSALGVDEDFFELGGQSLLALRMLRRVHAEMGAEIPLQTLFERSTVAEVAELVDGAAGVDRAELGADAEHAILEGWGRLLGRTDIDPDDDLLALHGEEGLEESIGALLTELRSTVGPFAEGLSRADVVEARSARNLAAVISDRLRQEPLSLVVPLQPDGALAPLFLVHAGGGYVFFYRALAAVLGPDHPVYGIRAATSTDAGVPFTAATSIEEVARRYIAELRSVQPEGPYFLGGACAGAVIAYEMARQLLDQGEQLAGPIVAIDSIVFNNRWLPPDDLDVLVEAGQYRYPGAVRHVRHRLGVVGRDASAIGGVRGVVHVARRLFVRLLRTAARAVRRGPGGSPLGGDETSGTEPMLVPEVAEAGAEAQVAEMQEILQTSVHLVEIYRPVPLDVAMVCFDAELTGPFARSWNGLARRGVVVYERPGDHLDMLEHPAVEETAELVRERLGWSAR